MVIAIQTGNTLLSLIFYPIISGSIVLYSIIGSEAYGAGKHNLFGTYLTRCKLFGYSITLVFLVLYLICSNQITQLFHLTYVQSSYVMSFFASRGFSLFFELELGLLLVYFQIISKGFTVSIILLVSSAMFPLYSYIFISFADWGLFGAGFTILAFNASLLLIFSFYLFLLGKNDNHIFPINNFTFMNLIDILKIFLPITFMNFVDNLSYETMTLFAFPFDKNQYSAYIIVMSIVMIIYSIANAFQVSANVLVSSYLGNNSPIKAKKISLYILFLGNVMGIFVCIITYILKSYLIKLIETDNRIADIANNIFIWQLVNIYLEISCSIFYGIFISVNKFNIVMLLYIFFEVLSILGILVMVKVVVKGVESVFIGGICARIIMLIVYFLVFTLLIDWKECTHNIQTSIDKEHLESEGGEK